MADLDLDLDVTVPRDLPLPYLYGDLHDRPDDPGWYNPYAPTDPRHASAEVARAKYLERRRLERPHGDDAEDDVPLGDGAAPAAWREEAYGADHIVTVKLSPRGGGPADVSALLGKALNGNDEGKQTHFNASPIGKGKRTIASLTSPRGKGNQHGSHSPRGDHHGSHGVRVPLGGYKRKTSEQTKPRVAFGRRVHPAHAGMASPTGSTPGKSNSNSNHHHQGGGDNNKDAPPLSEIEMLQERIRKLTSSLVRAKAARQHQIDEALEARDVAVSISKRLEQHLTKALQDKGDLVATMRVLRDKDGGRGAGGNRAGAKEREELVGRNIRLKREKEDLEFKLKQAQQKISEMQQRSVSREAYWESRVRQLEENKEDEE